MPIVAMARAMAAAIGTPPMPQRVDGEKSAIGITVAVLCCSNSRMTSGEKLFSDDCAQSMYENLSPGLPFAETLEVEPGTLRVGCDGRRASARASASG